MDWRDIPSLAALRAFEAAARHGSLTAAARELNVTHAAIAQHVRTVEAHLETALLVRQGRGMALTDAGAALAADLADGFGRIVSGVRAVTAAAEGRPLSVTVTTTFAESWLMPRLAGFWAAHPDVPLSITPGNAVSDLRRDGFDLGIRYGRGSWPGLTAEFLVSADYRIVAAPALIAGRATGSLDAVADLPWLFETVHREPRRWAEANGLDLSRVRSEVFATLGMVLAAVRGGAGVSILSHAIVEDDIHAGRLVSILDVGDTGLGYHIVRGPGPMSPAARAFVAWLRTQA